MPLDAGDLEIPPYELWSVEERIAYDHEQADIAGDAGELAGIRGDYQWFVCCQEMSLDELREQRYPIRADESKEHAEPPPQIINHYLKRYKQALIVYESRTREPLKDGMKTIREIVTDDPDLDSSIILKNAQRRVFQGRTRRAGGTWLIDVEHASFLQWQKEHRERGEGKH